MSLAAKFNLMLILIFALGLGAAGYVSYKILHENARREVISHAEMMMEAALAIRGYTVREIRPLLKLQLKRQFLPQSVPSYAATQNFQTLREEHPEYTYKEATLNPTNPRDKATDWETDIIQHFRNNEEVPQLTGERDTPTGRSLYLARPIRIKNEGCLGCHSTTDEAPDTMIKLYGTANGFGWQMGEIVGSQIVSVPLAVPIDKANHAFVIFMSSLAGIFAVIFLAVNVMLRRLVVRRVRTMARISDEISTGKMDAAEFEHRGKDEIAHLGMAFTRMRRSLEQAMKMLEE